MPIPTPKLSPLQASKLALSVVPVASGSALASLAENARVRAAVGDDFLIGQGLAPLWGAVRQADADGVANPLKARRIQASVFYLLQRSVLAELDAIFERAGIAYAVFKGAHVREWLYADPTLRDAADVEIAGGSATDNFIVSDRLVALLMSQLSENHELMRVFDALFDATQVDLSVVPFSRLGLTGASTARDAVVAGLERGMVVLGTVIDGAVKVNPAKSTSIPDAASAAAIVLRHPAVHPAEHPAVHPTPS